MHFLLGCAEGGLQRKSQCSLLQVCSRYLFSMKLGSYCLDVYYCPVRLVLLVFVCLESSTPIFCTQILSVSDFEISQSSNLKVLWFGV